MIYTQPASEVVIEGLLDLLAGVHHEGAVGGLLCGKLDDAVALCAPLGGFDDA